ncbi:MAG: class I SAM-dependent methyltransferase [Candidatus Hodarchaeales archaeon]|jgi:ubiquinone/menaquinone biosynthesis C-methylase UbiE
MRRLIPYIKFIFSRSQKITIDSIPDGSVIDIGGGGEGIIAQIGKERIAAIDKNQREIDEAKPNAPTANWILADATDLSYSNDYFDNATAFFSGMYMSMETFEKISRETYRVLKNNGEFWIWDANISNDKDLFLIRLQITLPNGKKIRTGYGTRGKNRSIIEIKQKLVETKFHIEMTENHGKWFFIKAIKKL